MPAPCGMQVSSSTHIFGYVQQNLLVVDKLQNTAGDIALSLNNEPCYTAIRDAGIRAGKVLGDSPFACFDVDSHHRINTYSAGFTSLGTTVISYSQNHRSNGFRVDGFIFVVSPAILY
jgi:hypothetical protein